jgi:hypothetical protein
VLHSPKENKNKLKRIRTELVADAPSKTPRLPSEDTFSMRGITSGVIQVNKKGVKRRCIVLGSAFPSWLLCMEELWFKVDRVLILSDTFIDRIYLVAGVDIRIWSGKSWDESLEGWTECGPECICFVDGRVTAGLLGLLAGLGVEEVISTQIPRRPIPGWNACHAHIPHTSVGGITLKVLVVLPHSKNPMKNLPRTFDPCVARDASTVLSQSVFGEHFRAPPQELFLEPLRCWNLGTEAHPIYHGFGWLPKNLNRSTRILIPMRNSSSNDGKWGLPRLLWWKCF